MGKPGRGAGISAGCAASQYAARGREGGRMVRVGHGREIALRCISVDRSCTRLMYCIVLSSPILSSPIGHGFVCDLHRFVCDLHAAMFTGVI